MKSFTTKLQILLALLLFGTMQQIHAQKWTGTWNTNLGEVKVTEHPNGNVTFGIGDYSFSGKTTKNLHCRRCIANGY